MRRAVLVVRGGIGLELGQQPGVLDLASLCATSLTVESRRQLEDELAEEAWIIEPPTREEIFTLDPTDLWAAVLRRKGHRYALLATMPPDPSLN